MNSLIINLKFHQRGWCPGEPGAGPVRSAGFPATVATSDGNKQEPVIMRDPFTVWAI